MSFINYAGKEINCKIVYFGAGLSGKTTNIQHIYDITRKEQKGSLVSLSSQNERTLFFDFLPLSIDDIKGFTTHFHLYSIPGQTFYDTSRQFILRGVDGIIFVADSDPERMEANLESYTSLEKALESQGYDIGKIPLVFQYNKRDLPDALQVHVLETSLNPMKKPFFESVAQKGVGVMETLQGISKQIIRELKGGNEHE